jgi:hypothetical protein
MNNWAVKLKFNEFERNEDRLLAICRDINIGVLKIAWFVSGLEATGKYGVMLSDENFNSEKVQITFTDVYQLLTEDGQVIEMQLEACCMNKSIFVIIQDGCYVNVVNNGISFDKDKLGDFEYEDFNLWKNLYP